MIHALPLSCRRHPRGGGGPRRRGAPPECFLGVRAKSTEAHAGNSDRNFQLDRLFSVARTKRDTGLAALTVAFKRIARSADSAKRG